MQRELYGNLSLVLLSLSCNPIRPIGRKVMLSAKIFDITV
jgi:hypothetical protein